MVQIVDLSFVAEIAENENQGNHQSDYLFMENQILSPRNTKKITSIAENILETIASTNT